MPKLKSIYSNYLVNYNSKKAGIKSKLRKISLVRLIFFLSTFISFYMLFSNSALMASLVALLLFGIFLFLVKYYIASSHQLDFYKQMAKINENELKAIEGDYSIFDSGKEFIDKSHDFSFDLDLFGDGSIFQFLNRSSVYLGANELANQLQNPLLEKEMIIEKQKAITDLTDRIDWRQKFIALGKLSVKSNAELSKLFEWLRSKSFFKNQKMINILSTGLAALTMLIFILVSFNILPIAFIVTTLIYQLAFYTFFARNINRYHNQISKYSKFINKYANLFAHIEGEEWHSEYLISRVKGLQTNGIASNEIKKLASLVGAIDTRLSPLLGFLLNWALLWDFHCIIKLENWKEKNKDNIDHWFAILAEIDSSQSLANFNYNNPQYVLPEINGNEFQLESENLGHPLIMQNERINNDFSMKDFGKFAIITGANMAGKSTFLRTVGVNLILAMTGAPVCAAMFKFSPIRVFSSMRTDDSLQRNKSYFFAELERLKIIFNKINSGEKLFLILDEILKGTNSKDKEKGSKAFMKKLISFHSNGIIATHDLSLGELEAEFPGNIKNLCFEVKIDEKELEFDYKLYPGVTKNLNASYLLEKMGIV